MKIIIITTALVVSALVGFSIALKHLKRGLNNHRQDIEHGARSKENINRALNGSAINPQDGSYYD